MARMILLLLVTVSNLINVNSEDICIKELTMDSWMSDLKSNISDWPISEIAIPGSHDSFSYFCDSDGPITITANIQAQLNAGMRYFEMTVQNNGNEYRFERDQKVCSPTTDVLEEMKKLKKWMDEHPEEVIILNVKRVYDINWNIKSNYKFVRELVKILTNRKIFKYKPSKQDNGKMKLPTLGKLQNKNIQYVILSDGVSRSYALEPIKTVHDFGAPLIDTALSLHVIYEFHNQRKQDCTSENYMNLVRWHMLLSPGIHVEDLYKKAQDFHHPLKLWLKKSSARPGPNGINIIVTDFGLSESYPDFGKDVVEVNIRDPEIAQEC